MTILEALAILKSTVLECKKRSVNTLEVTAALDILAPYVRPKWLAAEFRHHIAREHEKEEQQQVLRTTFVAIRDSVRELIGTEMDALARDFPNTDDTEVNNARACLAREYDKRGEPWIFVGE